MNLINQAHSATKFINSHGGASMNYQQKKQAIAAFSKRMTGIIGKTESAIKKAGNDDFAVIGFEFTQLKQDFQKLASECESHDQELFNFGLLLQKFETTFNKCNPLRYV